MPPPVSGERNAATLVVMPSQICEFIDRKLSYFSADDSPQSQMVPLSDAICAGLRALLTLIERVPLSLLPNDPNAFAELVLNTESLKYHVGRAEQQSERDRATAGQVKLAP